MNHFVVCTTTTKKKGRPITGPQLQDVHVVHEKLKEGHCGYTTRTG